MSLSNMGDEPAAIKQLKAIKTRTLLTNFPSDLLARATTLDPSQIAALTAMICRPVSLIQGPPGTGKVGTACLRAGRHERAACNIQVDVYLRPPTIN